MGTSIMHCENVNCILDRYCTISFNLYITHHTQFSLTVPIIFSQFMVILEICQKIKKSHAVQIEWNGTVPCKPRGRLELPEGHWVGRGGGGMQALNIFFYAVQWLQQSNANRGAHRSCLWFIFVDVDHQKWSEKCELWTCPLEIFKNEMKNK